MLSNYQFVSIGSLAYCDDYRLIIVLADSLFSRLYASYELSDWLRLTGNELHSSEVERLLKVVERFFPSALRDFLLNLGPGQGSVWDIRTIELKDMIWCVIRFTSFLRDLTFFCEASDLIHFSLWQVLPHSKMKVDGVSLLKHYSVPQPQKPKFNQRYVSSTTAYPTQQATILPKRIYCF